MPHPVSGSLGNFHHHRLAMDMADGIGIAVHLDIVKLCVAAADGIEVVIAEFSLSRGIAGLGVHGLLHRGRLGAVIASISSMVGE